MQQPQQVKRNAVMTRKEYRYNRYPGPFDNAAYGRFPALVHDLHVVELQRRNLTCRKNGKRTSFQMLQDLFYSRHIHLAAACFFKWVNGDNEFLNGFNLFEKIIGHELDVGP